MAPHPHLTLLAATIVSVDGQWGWGFGGEGLFGGYLPPITVSFPVPFTNTVPYFGGFGNPFFDPVGSRYFDSQYGGLAGGMRLPYGQAMNTFNGRISVMGQTQTSPTVNGTVPTTGNGTANATATEAAAALIPTNAVANSSAALLGPLLSGTTPALAAASGNKTAGSGANASATAVAMSPTASSLNSTAASPAAAVQALLVLLKTLQSGTTVAPTALSPLASSSSSSSSTAPSPEAAVQAILALLKTLQGATTVSSATAVTLAG